MSLTEIAPPAVRAFGIAGELQKSPFSPPIPGIKVRHPLLSLSKVFKKHTKLSHALYSILDADLSGINSLYI
jgi:hypothetical protein